MKKNRVILVTLLLLGVAVYYASHKMEQVNSQKDSLIHLQNDTPNGVNQPAHASEMHADFEVEDNFEATTAATAPQATEEELKKLTVAEQQSLWAAFAEARREVRSIPEAWTGRPENQDFDFYALHPKQKLTTRFGSQGVQLVSSERTYTEADTENPITSWQARMRLSSFAGQSVSLEAPPEQSAESSSKVEYRHQPGLVEWYDNGAAGVEHGYTIAARPAGLGQAEAVSFEVAVDGLQVTEGVSDDHRHSLSFIDGEREVLSYSKLLVVDAHGKELPATMHASAGGFTLAYHDTGAVYPVTVDPLIANEEAKLYASDAKSAAFGESVAISGDTVVIGAPGDRDGGVATGSAYVFVRSGSTWSLQEKLIASNAFSGDEFGASVAISGDSVIVGAPDAGDIISPPGRAYIFVRSGSSWSEEDELIASDAEGGDEFGHSVAISGDTAVVGAPNEDAGFIGSGPGAAYVFGRSAGGWTEEAKVIATDPSGGAEFGCSVTISGDHVAVGAYGASGVGSSEGSVHVYVRSGTTWPFQERLSASDAHGGDFFGYSVAMSGSSLIVGANKDDDGGSSSGSAYLFVRSGTSWSQQAKLVASDPEAFDNFGSSVGISGDSVVVGAYGDDDEGGNTGSAYVFVRSGSSWSQQAKFIASNAAQGDSFGTSVAISGESVIAGAPGDDDGGSSSGSAYVFVRSGSSWSEQRKLYISDAEAGDRFGYSVAISGDTAVVGSYFDDDGGSSSGSAYVFLRDGNSWAQQAKLTASDAAASDFFGYAVSISDESIVVGAYGDDDGGSLTGSAYVYVRSGATWSEQFKLNPSDAAVGDRFGNAVAISGDSVVVGAYFDDDAGSSSGSAYVFVRSGSSWSQQFKLVASDEAAGDWFGYSVAISGDSIVVGAFNNDDAGSASGSAYVYFRSGSSWSQQEKLTASDAAFGDQFGYSVGISGDYVIVGASYDDDGGLSSGSAYVFTRSGSSWSEQAKLVAADDASGDRFGYSVAIADEYAVIGAPYDDDGGQSSGSAYVFVRSGSSWVEEAKINASDGASDDLFGSSVAISGYSVIVGAYGDDDEGAETGSIYTYRFSFPIIRVFDYADFELSNGDPSAPFVGLALGSELDYTFRLSNSGEPDLDIQSISLGGADAGEFSLQFADISSSADLAADQDFDLTISFSPTGSISGLRNATVTIASNDVINPVFTFSISGLGLSTVADGDSDGMNDWGEYLMRNLGLDWEVTQPSLVSDYFAAASTNGLYTETEIQAIHVGSPLIEVTGGTATLIIGIEKSTDLSTFDPFPFTAPETSINGSGEIEFEFPVLDDAAFYILDVK